MSKTFAVRARTALSPEWDHGFDEAFTDLVSSDPDLVRAEFDALIGACWDEPPPPPTRPVPSPAQPAPSSDAAHAGTSPAKADPSARGSTTNNQRSPP
jgi:hypothetical protein